MNVKNKVIAIYTLAVPVLIYSFNVINWTLIEIKNTKIRKLITYLRMHQPRADIECFYIKRGNDGRGLVQLELTYKTITIGLDKYLSTTIEWIL